MGSFGCCPQLTRAKILHLKSISKILMPPSNSERWVDSIILLSSLEGILEGEGIKDFEPFLCPAFKKALVLVEANVEDMLLPCLCIKIEI
jgi:hypothetical protein